MSADIADAFDAWAREGAGARMEEAHEFAGKKVLDRISIGYDESFIDLGCGNGWATRYVAQKVPEIGLCVGVDLSAALIAEARKLSAAKYPVKFLVSPMEETPFGEAAFNHAFSMEAMYYTKDPLTAIKAAWRLLKAGGRFHLVIDYYKENPASAAWQADVPVKMHFLAADEWARLFKQAGFGGVRAERILDDRPIPPDVAFPWGGFKTRAALQDFRTGVGSLYLQGQKAELSHALDAVLERAKADVAKENERETARGSPKGESKKKRFGRS